MIKVKVINSNLDLCVWTADAKKCIDFKTPDKVLRPRMENYAILYKDGYTLGVPINSILIMESEEEYEREYED